MSAASRRRAFSELQALLIARRPTEIHSSEIAAIWQRHGIQGEERRILTAGSRADLERQPPADVNAGQLETLAELQRLFQPLYVSGA